MSLSKATLKALRACRYLAPTPVQAAFIPKALSGSDVMGQARTGTGKTAAFLIPILERLSRDEPRVQALILGPTRELTDQVAAEGDKLAHGRDCRIAKLSGGKPIRRQIDELRRGVQIAVGTPGRVIDHLTRGTLDLSGVRIAVLDEADRMLDIGFRPDIERILRRVPERRQTLLLSATVPPPVERLARRYMCDPEVVNLSEEGVAVETIEQRYFTVDQDRKFDLLVRLLAREKPDQAIIFCRTKRGTDRVARRLKAKLKDVAAIHGDLQQSARDKVMAKFRAGQIRFLVATDLMGRGIDVTTISHIFNYDVPEDCDDYVHRVGRTGRMGAEGIAFTFVTPEQGNELTRIEMRIDRLLEQDRIEGFDALQKPTATNGHVENGHGAFDAPEPAPHETPAKPRVRLSRSGRGTRRYRRAL